MKSSTEYEKKYKITEEQRLKLETHLGDFDNDFHQVDRYFDSQDASLFQRGIFMRIRGHRFQIKFNLQDVLSGQSSGHTQCTENDWSLNISEFEQKDLESTLNALGIDYPENISTPFVLFDYHGWIESVVINKKRSTFKLQNYTVSLDDVVGLGVYVEIESSIEAPTLSEKERRLFSFITEQKFEYIDTGYNALYWRAHNPEIYMKSPYVMQKDKNA